MPSPARALGSPILISVTVSPAAMNVPQGETQQFTATGHYSDTRLRTSRTVVTWSTSSATIATVSNASGKQGLGDGRRRGCGNDHGDRLGGPVVRHGGNDGRLAGPPHGDRFPDGCECAGRGNRAADCDCELLRWHEYERYEYGDVVKLRHVGCDGLVSWPRVGRSDRCRDDHGRRLVSRRHSVDHCRLTRAPRGDRLPAGDEPALR